MNIGLFRREHLQSGDAALIGSATADQFQRTHGAINAWQEVEHTDDGHHTAIHATSITVAPGGITAAGDVVIGGQLREQNRATAMGQWVDQPLASVTFRCSSGLFVPGAGSAVRLALIGKMVFLQYDLVACTIPVGAGLGLILTFLPSVLGGAGFALGGFAQPTARAADNGVPVSAIMQVSMFDSVPVQRNDGVQWSASAGLTMISGMFIGAIL